MSDIAKRASLSLGYWRFNADISDWSDRTDWSNKRNNMKYSLLCSALLFLISSTTVSASEVVNMNFDWKFQRGDHHGAEAVRYNDRA